MAKSWRRAWFFSVCLTASLGLAQDGPRKALDVRESMLLDVDSLALKKLAAAKNHLKPEVAQWREGITLLRQAAEQHGAALVPTGPRRYGTLRTASQLEFANLPPAGLAVYRGLEDAQYAKLYAEAAAARDAAALERIVQHGFATSSGDDALLLLGELAWERGELARARSWWEMLIPAPRKGAEPPGWLAYPDSPLPLADVRARLILCSLLQGDRARAEAEFAGFAAAHPTAAGTLAGESGLWTDLLKARIAAEPVPAAVPRDPATFAGNPARNGVTPAARIGGKQWSQPLRPFRENLPGRLPAFPRSPAPAYHPVVFRDPRHGPLVFVSGAEAIFGYQLDTGRPPYAEPEDTVDPADFQIYPPLPLEREDRLDREDRQAPLGVPRFTLTVADGCLYARVGALVANDLFPDDSPSRILCLNLQEAEGRLVWETSVDALELGEGRWLFEGTPVVVGRRAFVGLRRVQPQPQVNVVCLDAETGKLLWNRPICQGRAAGAAEQRELRLHLLTYAEDTLYYATHLGAIAALRPDTGELAWLATYPRRDEDDDPDAQLERLAAGLNPLLFHDGTLFVAPNDTRQLLAYDAATGLLLWEREFRRPVDAILGAWQGVVVVAADQLYGLETSRGRILGTAGDDDPEMRSFGRGLLAADERDVFIYWPQREQLVALKLDLRQPRNIFVPLQQYAIPGGNLATADGRLVVGEPDRLTAYGDFARLQQEGQKKVVAHPDAADAWLRLAEIESALTLDGPALQHAAEAHRRDPAVAGRYARLIRAAILRAERRQEPAAARELRRTLAGLELPSHERAAAWLQVARELNQDDPAAASAAWRKLQNDAALAAVRLRRAPGQTAQTVGELAQRELAAAPGDQPPRRVPPVAESAAPSHDGSPDALTGPFVRRWHEPAPHGALVPVGQTWKELHGLVLVPGVAVAACDLADGRPRWQAGLTGGLTWAGRAGDVVILASDRELAAVEAETGRLAWRHVLEIGWPAEYSPLRASLAASGQRPGSPTAPPPRLVGRPGDRLQHASLVGGTLLCQVGAELLCAFQPADGAWLWQLEFPGGLGMLAATPDGRRLAVEVPARRSAVMLDRRHGTILGWTPPAAGPWKAPPAVLDNGALATIERDDKLVGVLPSARAPLWTYGGPVGRSFAPPEFLTNGRDLVFVNDGDTLVGLNPTRGTVLWKHGLGRDPLPHLGELALCDSDRLLVASAGVLRCISLRDGTRAWETHLGPRRVRTRLLALGPLVAAVPVDAGGAPFDVVLVERATGLEVQRLRCPAAGPVALTPAGRDLVLLAADRLTIFSPAEAHVARPAP